MTMISTDLLKQKFLCDLQLAFQKPELRLTIGDIGKVMRLAAQANYKPLELLHEALKQHLQPTSTNHTNKEIPAKKPGALQCTKCQKVFDKGVAGYNGYKRLCTQSCTKEDLK